MSEYRKFYAPIKRGGALRSILKKLLASKSHCSKILGEGSFGSVFSRKDILMHTAEVFDGRRTVFNDLVVKVLKQPSCEGCETVITKKGSVKKRLSTSDDGWDDDDEDSDTEIWSPAAFTVKTSGKITIVHSKNTPKYGGVLGEVIANLLVTEMFRYVTPHFTYMAGFSSCDKSFEMYFEAVGKTVTKSKKDDNLTSVEDLLTYMYNKNQPITNDIVDAIMLPMFHTLHVMKLNYDMNHFDLHIGNLYIKTLDDRPYFQGHNMQKFNYFCYHVGKHTFYLKNVGFLIKVGDMGMTQSRLGKTWFTNTTAQDRDRYDEFIPNKRPGHQFWDWLMALETLVTKLRAFDTIQKLNANVYPMSSLKGVDIKDVFWHDDVKLDVKKVPNVEEILLNFKVFDHLKKTPKCDPGKILHIHETSPKLP